MTKRGRPSQSKIRPPYRVVRRTTYPDLERLCNEQHGDGYDLNASFRIPGEGYEFLFKRRDAIELATP